MREQNLFFEYVFFILIVVCAMNFVEAIMYKNFLDILIFGGWRILFLYYMDGA